MLLQSYCYLTCFMIKLRNMDLTTTWNIEHRKQNNATLEQQYNIRVEINLTLEQRT